uniref:FHA domain-containing protein n=1 Tax=Octopus bimaculoides TaxID=37653 RepID=A0A0L8GQG0_OCTBM
MIGRNPNQVDYVIDSSNFIQSSYISRNHARVVRQPGNIHRLYDDSLNGVFVNNQKISGGMKVQNK